ncbi:hypothetical protein SARC_15674 [Sphaeroforma arctica JP610]|uniref:Uncharacterized protein n=1 Tax=Sphaeroforma arctica JP610 TaxID=667725 RepID=A0A0L0F4W9_9EUKA|nr:hypothetical protein SARC_15674 [Sphaeroforma arctica JP610]KNC71780.1 hypothetical protein SARC_15674 [Sphaeroforma arctica JP610]|eukprot:XP_014145682.1 hypothetical protein SARC_15674 [Sphaeroforma arctica JP610]
MRFKNLEKLISCFKMWDLGKARCYYKNVLRGFYGSRHLILAGTKSPWAKKYKNPDDHAVRINVDRKKRMPSKKEIAEVKKLRGLENV